MNIALLCFGISSISSVSGMEKVFVDMANAFVKRGYHVWNMWNDQPGVVPFYAFDTRVHQVNLGLGRIQAPLRYKVLRELNKGLHINAINKVDEYKTNILCNELRKRIDLQTIDVFICYEFNSVMVANRLSMGKIPVVAMVHNSVEDQIAALTPLQRQEASKADIYQVLMPSYVSEAEKLLSTKIVYIPNVVFPVEKTDCAQIGIDKKNYRIVHVGRIEGRQKRQFILIQSFAKLAKKFPEWEIYFYGPVGDLRYKDQIDKFVKLHNLEGRIHFEGVTKNVLSKLSAGDIFAFPSAYEGFSLALTEAMSVGLPVLGFNYAPSVKDLVISEQNGYLVKDEEEFTQKLSYLMGNKDIRAQFGANAREAMKQYEPDVVWESWLKLLGNLVEKYKNRK